MWSTKDKPQKVPKYGSSRIPIIWYMLPSGLVGCAAATLLIPRYTVKPGYSASGYSGNL